MQKKLEEISLEKLISESKNEIEKHKSLILEYTKKLWDVRHRNFIEKYNMTPRESYQKYVEIVRKCEYMGGRGYPHWIPELEKPHMMIDPNKYKDCQPSQQDLDAFYIIKRKHMKIPTDTFYWAWGN